MDRSAVRESRLASTRTVVAEVVFVVTFVAVSHVFGNVVVALTSAVVLGALPFARLGGRPLQWWLSSATSYLGRGRAGRRRTRSSVMSYPLRGDRVGMRWDGARLSASIEVNPLYSGPTVSSRESSTSDTRLPLEALARCLVQHDLGHVALDVTTHGKRAGTDPVATDVYHRLIGPLPTVAVRSIFVTVTVDAARAGRASDRRGHGFTGAAASLGVAIERVEHVLAAAGLGARVLTASEFSAVARYVSGAAPTTDAGWSHIDLAAGSWTARAVSAGSVSTATLDQLSCMPTAATTTTLRLRSSDRPGSVRASLTYGYGDSGSSVDDKSISGSMSLRGRLQIARTGQVPPATAGHDSLAPFADLDPQQLADLAVPASGAGQLLGSDSGGRGVTVRLFGPGTFTVHVSGELFLAKQLALRAIAIGARVLVATDRSDDWRRLAAALSDRRHLTVVESLGSDASEPGVAHDLIIVDGRFSRPPSSSASTLYLVDHPAHFPEETADVVIVQPDCAGDRVRLSWWSGSVDVTVVTIAQETALIGRPRPVVHAG